MTRTAFPRPRDDDAEDVIWALSTAFALWTKEHHADALVWLNRASQAASESGEALRAEELAYAARNLRIALEDEASEPPEPSNFSRSRPPPPLFRAPPPPPRLPSVEPLESAPPLVLDDDDDDLPTDLLPPPPESEPDDMLDPWAEKTPAYTPEPSVITSALSMDELRRLSKRPPPPPPPPSMMEVEPEQEEGDDEEIEAPISSDTRPTWRPPAPPSGETPAPVTSRPPAPMSEPPALSISLDEVSAFVDLTEDAQAELAKLARVEKLREGEELNATGLLLVVEGVAHIQPAIWDATAAIAKAHEVIYAEGSLEQNFPLRVVAEEGPLEVAIWSDEVIAEALANLPWVMDELRAQADRIQALAGASLGSIGERLDAMLRGQVLDRLRVRVLDEGEVIAHEGKPVPGMVIVGAGALELGAEKLHPGDLLFPREILGGGVAPSMVRAAPGGALILFGDRHLAQELLVTWPPLLEIFAAG